MYANVSWKSITLLANFVFTCVFSFLGGNPSSTHTFSHSMRLFPLFLVQANCLLQGGMYNFLAIFLSYLDRQPLHLWHIDSIWTQHGQTNGLSKVGLHDTKVQGNNQGIQFCPSVLQICPKFCQSIQKTSRNGFTTFARVAPDVFAASNRPSVTCLGIQEPSIKFTTM